MKVANMKQTIVLKIIQFYVNSNKVTTGHKLQGVSMNRMVVRSWSYWFSNWVYLVLSRVWTLKGLFICKMDNTKLFIVWSKNIGGGVWEAWLRYIDFLSKSF